MTKIINLFSGPGAGKSTTAAGLFFKMKTAGKRVELVTEYAKELVYACDFATLNDQYAVTMEQDARLRRLLGEVDFVINDSPLLFGLVYATETHQSTRFYRKVRALWSSYDNVNFFINRVKPYQPYGRSQMEWEALEKDVHVRHVLEIYPFTEVDGDEQAPDNIMSHLFGTRH